MLDFSVRITDYDDDSFDENSVGGEVAKFKVGIDGTGSFDDDIVIF